MNILNTDDLVFEAIELYRNDLLNVNKKFNLKNFNF